MKTLLSFLLASGIAFGAGCSKPSNLDNSSVTVALLPKSKGNAYFISVKNGAEKAANELGVDLIFDGPTATDPAQQNEIIENWITLGVDVIAAACENKEGISAALRKAQAKGVQVITYDADAMPDARSFFVNQATPEGIGYALMDEAARLTGAKGKFAVISATLTAGNQREWLDHIQMRLAEQYPNMELVSVRPCDDKKDKAQAEATALMSANPDLKLIMATCSPAVPGAAEAVKQAGKVGKVRVVGLGMPAENSRYVHEGVTDTVILWDTKRLGYLTVYSAVALAKGKLTPQSRSVTAGSMGEFQVVGDNIMLGDVVSFTRENIDDFDF